MLRSSLQTISSLNISILAFPRYSALGASSRMRFYQFGPFIEEAGITVNFQPLINKRMLLKKYRSGRYSVLHLLGRYLLRIKKILLLKSIGFVWIEKESLPWMPAWLELWLLADCNYVLDFDDAVFHNYDLHRNRYVRFFMGKRIDRLMAQAKLVIVGNQYLATRASEAGATWVEVIPTVVDMERYDSCIVNKIKGLPRVVWIGSPTSVQYLLEIVPALKKLFAIHPFILRVIGGGQLNIPDLQLECVEWSEHTEAYQLKECHLGIMPLLDTPWEQGKCAYKLIQYMASGLPTVSSPIGANSEVVLDGVTGFLASTEDEWVEYLACLINDSVIRERMGQAGHLRASERYSLKVIAPKLLSLLTRAKDLK